jgi:serine/threonine protein kinase
LRSSLADYQLLGSLVSGGENDGTWLARPPARLGLTQSTVVVTEIPDPGANEWGDLIERLSDLASVRHEHLPRLIEAGRIDDGRGDASRRDSGPVAWVTRDAADARPLRPGSGSRDQALGAVAGAARAAHALHQAGWAHGDIRPTAILVGSDTVMLEPPLRTVATPPPLAGPPRGSTGFDSVDPSALWGEGPSRAGDIWSLAATAHALVTGRLVHPALPGDPIVTAAQRILIEAPHLASELDPGLSALLRACLSPDPADRPPTADDLAGQLDRLVGHS